MKKSILFILLLCAALVYADDPFAPGGSMDGTNLVNVPLDGYEPADWQPIDSDLTYLSGLTLSTDVKAILEAADDDEIKVNLDIDDIQEALDIVVGETVMGTFTGDIISDSVTIAVALQELETAMESFSDNIVNVADPNADRGYFWDDNEGTPALWTPGDNLAFDTTTFRAVVPTVTDANGFTMTATQGFGYTVYATGAGTIVMPPVAAGMQFTVENHTANDVNINPDASGTEDTIRIEGVALDQGDSIVGTDLGDTARCTYYAADTWSCITIGYEDAGD